MKLTTVYSPDKEIASVLAHFDGLKLEFLENESIDHGAKLSLISHARLMSSHSLRSKTAFDLANWNLAQHMVMTSLDKTWDWNFILEVNSLITGNQKFQCERESDIYAGGVAFVDNHQKLILLESFKSVVLSQLEQSHPLVASTMLRYWLVSIHPFLDGNGRTAQTLGDAWLLKFNYPPLVFKNPYQGQYATMPEIRQDFSFEDALQSTFVGLSNSFSLMNLN